MNNKIYLCAICNIQSGTCSEDCKFCTQSVKHKADIQRYKTKDIDDIIYEAGLASQNKAIGFCLVTAGVGLDDTKVETIANIAYKLKKLYPNLSLIGCNGIASKEQLSELKKAGLDNYNHNLEASKEYYSSICTTHSWEDRYQTCLDVKEVGLNLCSGGIFGMGESIEQRDSLLNSIKSLEPMSVPLNFFIPNPALPLSNNISKDEAFGIISKARELLPQSMIMVAGGRESTFGNTQYDIFKYGANSIVIGDYLTTTGETTSKDIQTITKLGYEIATDCQR
jgi:biotin synthase